MAEELIYGKTSTGSNTFLSCHGSAALKLSQESGSKGCEIKVNDDQFYPNHSVLFSWQEGQTTWRVLRSWRTVRCGGCGGHQCVYVA